MARKVRVIIFEMQNHHYGILRVNSRVSVLWVLDFLDGSDQLSRIPPASAFNVIVCDSPEWSYSLIQQNLEVSLLLYKRGLQVFNFLTTPPTSNVITIILWCHKSVSIYSFIFMMEKPKKIKESLLEYPKPKISELESNSSSNVHVFNGGRLMASLLHQSPLFL